MFEPGLTRFATGRVAGVVAGFLEIKMATTTAAAAKASMDE
jgi:hypothetical protein